jgi:hypothetical protein
MVGTRVVFYANEDQAMPKILPTFAAIAIIGVCIAFNTVRYPIVWEMTGPNAQPPLSENHMLAADDARTAKTISPATMAQNPAQPASAPPVTEVAAEKIIPTQVQSEPPPERPALTQAVPISLPSAELAATDAKKADEKPEPMEKVENISVPPGENFVPPPARLVPVSGDRSAVISQGANSGEVRRLPPVEVDVALPADRYAAEYPPTAFPIYPSTGK